MRTHILAAGLIAGAIAAPAASARPIDEFPIRSTPAPMVTRSIDDGFDWGSALLGAGGATAALLLTAAATGRRSVKRAA